MLNHGNVPRLGGGKAPGRCSVCGFKTGPVRDRILSVLTDFVLAVGGGTLRGDD